MATLGRWSFIYDEILRDLESSGLLNHAQLHVSIVGHGFDKPSNPRYSYVHPTDNVSQFEFPTLKMLWDNSRTHDGSILYLHTKGATRYVHTVDQWRHMMMHFCVKRWQTALHHLNDSDVTGCNLHHQNGQQFFSGNFWWAKAKYIRTLPNPNLYMTSRVHAETWIGLNNMPHKFHNMYSSNVDHYATNYPMERYQHL